MTGETDPRDVMQAEHDAGLSEHPAFRAPAEMPGVEEIGQALAIFFANNRQPCMSGDPRDRLSPLRRRDLDDATSAILALFAPIMAGKERTALRRETRALSQAQEWRNIAEKAEARALAAEAENKRLEGVLARYIEEVGSREGTDFIDEPGYNGRDEAILYRCSGRDAEGNFTDEARAIAAASPFKGGVS